jgi:uncharacterized membrane protein
MIKGSKWVGCTAIRGLVSIVTLIFSTLISQASTYTFTSIDVPGANSTIAQSISNTGNIVGHYFFGSSDSAGNVASNVFVLNGGTFSTFAYPGAYNSYGFGINNSQQVVGVCGYEFYGTFGTCQKFFGIGQGWVKSGSNFSLVNFPGSIPNATDAHGISDSGQIVGSYELPGGTVYGYELSGGTYTSIDPFGSTGATAFGINNSGQIVGSFCTTSACQQSGYFAAGVGGPFTAITVPGAYDTYAYGLNDLGQVVGWYSLSPSGPYESFLWDAGTFDFLDDPSGINGTFATGVNDAGEIVGYYLDNEDIYHGFIATPGSSAVPEPSTMSILSSAVGILMLICCPPPCSRGRGQHERSPTLFQRGISLFSTLRRLCSG